MNKETELYLIKRIEELSKELAYANKDIEKLTSDIDFYVKPCEKDKLKAQAYDVISKFITIQCNPLNNTYKIVFVIPEIEINLELATMLGGLENNNG